MEETFYITHVGGDRPGIYGVSHRRFKSAQEAFEFMNKEHPFSNNWSVWKCRVAYELTDMEMRSPPIS